MTAPAAGSSTVAASAEPAVDGRTARRDRNREAVLDAVIDLFTEGEVGLSAADVAERSGVSLRSVYRYFDDLEALARAAIARQMERFAPLADLADVGEGALADRIERTVAGRVRLYEAVAPTRRAAVQRSAVNPLIGEQIERTRELLDAQTEAMFAPELDALSPADRRELAPALVVLLGFETFDQLHQGRGLSVDATGRVLRRTLTRLLS